MQQQLVFVLFLIVANSVFGQGNRDNDTTLVHTQYNIDQAIDVNFLFGYYSQDGVHSAVTGGEGTEELKDHDLKILINIPLDSSSSLNIDSNINYYTSASTDNIDLDVSSASSEDLRTQLYMTYGHNNSENDRVISFGIGGSLESDYTSTAIKGGWSKVLDGGNKEISVSGNLFLDRWVLIIPDELRNVSTLLPATDKRRSFNLGIFYAFVINKKIQAAVSTDFVYQRGLLSTPFHRVFFYGQEEAKIERLPLSRFKMPIGLRGSYYLTDYLVLQTYHRYYWDDFGLRAWTHSFEPRIKISNYFTLYSFYRYYQQAAATYFSPYKEHRLEDNYYTSDYDLSKFNSHKYGLGVGYSPLYAFGKVRFLSKKKYTYFKSFGLRYSRYHRSDGLTSYMVSFDLGMVIDK